MGNSLFLYHWFRCEISISNGLFLLIHKHYTIFGFHMSCLMRYNWSCIIAAALTKTTRKETYFYDANLVWYNHFHISLLATLPDLKMVIQYFIYDWLIKTSSSLDFHGRNIWTKELSFQLFLGIKINDIFKS